MKKWQKLVGYTVAATLILLSGGVLSISYYFTEVLLHNPIAERAHYYERFPQYLPTTLLKQEGLTDAEKISLTTEDGLKLNALYFPSHNHASIIAQHGYKATLSEMIPIAAVLVRHGYGAILFDARAHGESEGELITFGRDELQDWAAAYRYLLTRSDVDPEKIGAIGNSMGAALAIVYAARNPQIKAVVAHGPYASLPDTVAVSVKKFTGLPSFPFSILILHLAEYQLSFSMQNVSPLHSIHQLSPRPIFILAAGQDTFVNPDSGHKLYEVAKEPRELWFEANLEHVQFNLQRPKVFEQRVIGFFDNYLLNKQ